MSDGNVGRLDGSKSRLIGLSGSLISNLDVGLFLRDFILISFNFG